MSSLNTALASFPLDGVPPTHQGKGGSGHHDIDEPGTG
jgi:hypothetical protein